MKLIQLDRLLPDGRVMKYHRVHEFSISAVEPDMLVLMGSWSSVDGAKMAAPPESTSAIRFPNDPATYLNMLDHVVSLPEWSAGQIVDL